MYIINIKGRKNNVIYLFSIDKTWRKSSNLKFVKLELNTRLDILVIMSPHNLVGPISNFLFMYS